MELIQSSSEEVAELRQYFLDENKLQFIHNKCHQYGWADVYAIADNNKMVGYGSIWGQEKREVPDTVFEFYLLPSYRKLATEAFRRLIAVEGVSWLECQTNIRFLSSLFFEHARNIQVQALLFEDSFESRIKKETVFRKNEVKPHSPADSGEYTLSLGDEVVATGGFMMNYNFPYADIYMEVKPGHKQKGYGSFIVQELKKEIYRQGRVPSARCNPGNLASKLTLQKAGFSVCGALLLGQIRELT